MQTGGTVAYEVNVKTQVNINMAKEAQIEMETVRVFYYEPSWKLAGVTSISSLRKYSPICRERKNDGEVMSFFEGVGGNLIIDHTASKLEF